MSEEIPRRRKKKVPGSLRGPKYSIKSAHTQEKRSQALELRKKGYGYQRIADEMGLSTAMTAWRYVNDAIAAIPTENARDAKAIELQKLDAREMRLTARLEENLSIGDHVKIELALTKVQERRARYCGFDAPIRAEMSGRDGGPIMMTATDLKDLTDEQLDAIVNRSIDGRRTDRGDHLGEAEEASRETSRLPRTH